MLHLPLGSIAYGLTFGSGPGVGSIFVSGLNIYSRKSHIAAHDYSQTNI